MPRSTRHKSSKHNKDATKDYSDSEKETSLLKEKKSKEESSSRVSGDKRKEYYDSVNGEYYEEYTSSSSSKRRKGKSGGESDRWNGKDDEKGESSKKVKVSSEKSRKRDEVDGEEVVKKSSGKSDGKHRESSRRESKEFEKEKDKDRDKDRKYKESKSDKFYDGDDHHHKSKVVSDKTGEIS